MNRSHRTIAVLALAALAALLAAPAVFAGTQDFTLINQTGVEIYSLHVSETTNEEWEEDVLGENTLPPGQRINIKFQGREACLWDILVTDDEDNTLTWTGINLCEASVVVLRCNENECWAEFE